MTFTNGDVYEGEWKNGLHHGQGTYTWSSGKKYEGEWKDSKKDGQGTMTLNDGSKGIGEFRENRAWNITHQDKNGNIIATHVNGERKRATDPGETTVSSNMGERTREALKTLTKREENVLRLRFGIDSEKDLTLEEVAQDFEVTRERIRQIEAKALRKLRHPTRSKLLKSFYDKKDDKEN